MAAQKRGELALAIISIVVLGVVAEKATRCVQKTCKCSRSLSLVKCRAANLSTFTVDDIEEAVWLNVEVLDLRKNRITEVNMGHRLLPHLRLIDLRRQTLCKRITIQGMLYALKTPENKHACMNVYLSL